MKEFKTSKGEFVVISLTTREERGVDCNPMLNLICKLSEATEEDAIEVVEEYIYNTGEVDGYYDYENDTQTDCPIEALSSILTSKGIDINNGNWYLFKKV